MADKPFLSLTKIIRGLVKKTQVSGDGTSRKDVTTSVDPVNIIVYRQDSTLSCWFIGDPSGGATGSVPVFPNVYIGIGAAVGATLFAYFVRRRLTPT